mgnify:CR=1 FL=1
MKNTENMKYGSLVIEKKEYVLLKRLMNLSGYYKDETFRKSVEKLVHELKSAHIIDDDEMPDEMLDYLIKLHDDKQSIFPFQKRLLPPLFLLH